MKIKNKIRLGALATVLASPIIALPLINATKSQKGNDRVYLNVPEKRINLTEKSYYIIRFAKNSQWGEYGILHVVHIDKNDTIPILQVPATIEQEGVTYKIREADCQKHTHGNGTLNLLDFSQAEWLDTIEDYCFDYMDDMMFPEHIKIRSVNFVGAKRLRIIGHQAFNRQWLNPEFDVNNKVMDFSQCPLLEKIDKEAFYCCCEQNKNTYNAIIFPPNIKVIDKDSFSADNNKTRIYFRKVIYTSSNPPSGLFVDGMPRIADTDGKNIVVPYGCREKYIKLPHFDSTYEKNVYESTIRFNSSQGSTNLVTTTRGNDGADKLVWVPEDSKGVKHPDTKLWLSVPFTANMTIDSQGRISWQGYLPKGEHLIYVCGYKYDNTYHTIVSAISATIKFTVYDAELTGGTTHLKVTSGEAGQDTKKWKINMNYGQAAIKPSQVKYNLGILPTELSNIVSVEQTTTEGTIKWTDAVPAGQYSFILEANVTPQNAQNTFKVFETIYLSCDSTSKGMTIKYSNDGSDPSIDYKGEHLPLDKDKKLNFWISETTPSTWLMGAKMELSIEQITPVWDPNKSHYGFYFNDENHKVAPGKYQFYAHTLGDGGGTKTYDIYSDMFDITVGGSDISLEEIPSDLTIPKGKAGSKSIKVVNTEDAYVTNVNALNAPWVKNDTRLANRHIRFDIDPDDRQSILVTWDDQYFTKETENYDILDAMVDVYVQKEQSNEHTLYHKGLSIVGTNYSEIEYGDATTKIEVYPNRDNVSPAPFIFKLNGGTEVPQSVTWGCYSENDKLQAHIDVKPLNDSEAYLTCALKGVTDVPAGQYNVAVYGYDKNNLTACYTNIVLDISLKAEILDAPDQLQITANTAGKLDKPILTFVGDKQATSVEYSIVGFEDNMTVDENGYITWNDKISQGDYEMLLTATTTFEGKKYNAYKYIFVSVLPKAKNNTGAIVGGSVGGAVAVGGATAGGILGSKKHRLLKGKRK